MLVRPFPWGALWLSIRHVAMYYRAFALDGLLDFLLLKSHSFLFCVIFEFNASQGGP